jgi:hypothetical protein
MNQQFKRNEPHRTQVEENPFVLSIMLVLISVEACPLLLFIQLTNQLTNQPTFRAEYATLELKAYHIQSS